MATTPEAKVKAQVVKILKSAGAWHCFPVASGYGRSGIPDIIACIEGKFVAVECKAGKGKTTALQDRELVNIWKAGGATWVVNEEKIEEFRAYVERGGYRES